MFNIKTNCAIENTLPITIKYKARDNFTKLLPILTLV